MYENISDRKEFLKNVYNYALSCYPIVATSTGSGNYGVFYEKISPKRLDAMNSPPSRCLY